MGSRRYLLKKLSQAFFTLLFVLAFNFFLFRVMPSDPVRLLAKEKGVHLTKVEQLTLAHDLGLDLPLPTQFLHYLNDTIHGRFGNSFIYPGRSVMSVVVRFLWPTVLLVGTATVLMTIIGTYLGIRGGWNRGKAGDLVSMGSSLVLYSMPDFWMAMMFLIIFSTALGWFPSGGYSSPDVQLSGFSHVVDVANHMFLPCLTLTLGYLGEYYLVMRSAMLDVLGEEYITTVRAKGVREGEVLWGHAVRNALLPTISQIALGFGFVITGALVVELVFSYPGLGLLSYQAIESQDYLLLQAFFLFASLTVLLFNLLADILYSHFDPRVREA
jgi:peptide/nickel transport system permease protein